MQINSVGDRVSRRLLSLSSSPDSFSNLSPPAQLSIVNHKGKSFYVVREDLLPGGTKQRAIAQFALHITNFGYDHFVYASPFCGFAQIALAYVCNLLEIKCTIVAEADPYTLGKHEYTQIAERYKAQIILAKSLQEAEEKSVQLVRKQEKMYKAPLGFDCLEYRSFLKRELETQWSSILKTLPHLPKGLWLPVGSGALTQVFSQVVSPQIKLNCVNVHVLADEDQRIQTLRSNPQVHLFSSPQKFTEAADDIPQIPSNLFYDAKLWHFIIRYAEEGDIWWNVGR